MAATIQRPRLLPTLFAAGAAIGICFVASNAFVQPFTRRNPALRASIRGSPASADASLTRRTSGDLAADADRGDTAPLTASANLAKSIVGSGMLSLPAGLASFASGSSSIAPAIIGVLIPLGLLSAHTFYLVGMICERTDSDNYGEAWGKLLGESSGRVISFLVALECAGSCVAYTMILGDTLHLLLQPVTSTALVSRSSIILSLTCFVLFPLTRLRNLSPLGKFSIVGNFASVFVAFFVVFRFFQKSYAPGGAFFAHTMGAASMAGKAKGPLGSLILASMFGTAYVAHFNSPRMYRELSAPPKGGKLQRFAWVCVAGFSVAMIIYSVVMSFGYLTFREACLGNILDNYAVRDALAGVAKAAVATSLLFGHPFLFVALRDSVETLTGLRGELTSIVLLAGCTGVACLIRDLGRMQALEGAIMGAFLVYMGPALMAAKLSKGWARVRNLLIAGVGSVLAVAGAWVTLTS